MPPRGESEPWWTWALAIAGVIATNAAIFWAAYRESLGPPEREREPRPRPELGPMLPVDVELGDGPGFTVRDPARAWATAYTATELRRALGRFHEARGVSVRVLDVSKQGGGALAPHKSHKQGRDVDLGLPSKLGDLAVLLAELARSPGIEAIYLDHEVQASLYDVAGDELRAALQWPEAPHTGSAIIRHWPGHVRHIHVRFYR